MSATLTSFRGLLVKLDRDTAPKAQRIATLPENDLDKTLASAQRAIIEP